DLQKATKLPHPSDPIKDVADEAVNDEMDDSLERVVTTATSLDAEQDIGVNIPRSSEDSLKLNELMELCTKLQQKVLDLETTKITRALEIDSLKRRGWRADIDANKDIYLVNVHNNEDIFGVNDVDGDEVIFKSVDVAEQAKEVVNDITLVKDLIEIKSAKPKDDKVVIQEPEQGTTTTTPTIITAASSRPKAKGLVIHEQEQAHTYEQYALTDEEKARLFMELLEKRRKFFATKRAEEKRNKPPTQAQQRKIMCTYLKNIEGKKLKDLKNKSFDFIRKMFDRAFKRVNTFIDYSTELVLESSKKAKAEVTEGSSKRAGEELEQENDKK
nr:hypothetical protein [Tanacetum cinerariifolium]